jgi:hypothetical protein
MRALTLALVGQHFADGDVAAGAGGGAEEKR